MSERVKHDDFSFDVIGDILETLRFRSTIFFHSELAAPWGASFPPIGLPRFHIALAGNFLVGSSDNEKNNTINIRQGGIALLPTGEHHWIADQSDSKLTPSSDMSEACKLAQPFFKQGKITHRVMCGIVHYDQQMGHPIFDSLSEILHFPDYTPNDPVWMIITLIDQEMQALEHCASTNAIVDRLTEALFIKLINSHLQDTTHNIGFIGALHDRRIHQALTLIHQQPQYAWNIDTLSRRVGMSSSTLTRHFQKTLNTTPMTYIANWRMIKAHHLIQHTDKDLEHIAEMVGFGSARTLNKAFQRHYKYTPSELRDNHAPKVSHI